MADNKPWWTYTEIAEGNLRQRKLLEERGQGLGNPKEKFYAGRPLIARDTIINGGVYYCTASEAIVVDDKLGPYLKGLYNNFLGNHDSNDPKFRDRILTGVLPFVLSVFPYSQQKVDETNVRFGIKPGNKIDLAAYIQGGGGVCRHQALLAGYLLERIINDERLPNRLQGKVSVDRNLIPGRGGHAWVRYTNRAGDVFVIDPAINRAGPIDQVEALGEWSYQRPV